MKKPLFISVLIVLISSAALAGDYDLYVKAGDRSSKWDGMVKAGFNSYDTGDLGSGLVFLQKAYNMGCRDGLLLFKLGIYYESQKNYKEAEKFLKDAAEKLAAQYPDYKETNKMHEHLGRMYYASNQFDKALPEIEEALKASPDNFMLLFMSGQIYRLGKQYNQAIANFEKALNVIASEAKQSQGAPGIATPAQKDGGLAMTAQKMIYQELMSLYFEIKDFSNCLKYAETILKASPMDRAALSYKQQIQQMQYKQREQEAIKKITE